MIDPNNIDSEFRIQIDKKSKIGYTVKIRRTQMNPQYKRKVNNVAAKKHAKLNRVNKYDVSSLLMPQPIKQSRKNNIKEIILRDNSEHHN